LSENDGDYGSARTEKMRGGGGGGGGAARRAFFRGDEAAEFEPVGAALHLREGRSGLLIGRTQNFAAQYSEGEGAGRRVSGKFSDTWRRPVMDFSVWWGWVDQRA